MSLFYNSFTHGICLWILSDLRLMKSHIGYFKQYLINVDETYLFIKIIIFIFICGFFLLADVCGRENRWNWQNSTIPVERKKTISFHSNISMDIYLSINFSIFCPSTYLSIYIYVSCLAILSYPPSPPQPPPLGRC